MPRGVTLFRVAGIPIRVDPSWLIIAGLIVWTLSVAYFPQVVPGLRPSSYWIVGSLAALGFFASVLLHELSHALVALHYRLPVRAITLFIFGGVSEITEEPQRPGIEFRMAVAGPLASFAIGATAYLIAWLITQGGPLSIPGQLAEAGFGYLATINVLLGLFNLIPGFPLDGGRMLRSAIWRWKGDLRLATRWASYGGKAFAAILITLGLTALVNGAVMQGLWYGFIGLFLWQAADTAYTQLVMSETLRGLRVGDLMSRPAIAVPADLSITRFVDQFIFRQRHTGYPVVVDDRPIGLITLQQVRQVPNERWNQLTVSDIMVPLRDPLSPDDDLAVAIQRLTEAGQSRWPVAEHHRLVGVISLSDLAVAIERAPLAQRRAA
ncbi:MAG: site-2 protease family protein [Candidatus Sericytochromatia bacterium]|nr:site-2 protease family protein [Candidatus Sericytochromatia bacterium]